jgi:hypothetical protein
MAYTKDKAQPKHTKRPTITVRSSSWSQRFRALLSRQTLERRPEPATPAEIASRITSVDGSGQNHLFPLLPFPLPTTLLARGGRSRGATRRPRPAALRHVLGSILIGSFAFRPFAGDQYPLGMRTPLFPPCCEKPSTPNPNLIYLGICIRI